MPVVNDLPDDYNPYEHLLSVYRLTLNDIIRHNFTDIISQDGFNNISKLTPRQSLYLASLHDETDTEGMTKMRTDLFFMIMRKASDLQAPIYGEPTENYQETRKFKPQIALHFIEPHAEVEPGYYALRSVIKFRIVNETSETFTMAEANRFATEIKTLFGGGAGFQWHRGKELFPYTDKEKGYQLKLLCRNTATAVLIIEKVLEIQGHSIDLKKLTLSNNAEPAIAFPTVPHTEIILGKPHKLPRKRAVGTVHFQYALLHLWGKPSAVVLFDPFHHYSQAILR